MRDEQNILEVGTLHPDYMGFIFYPSSKRFVGDILKPEVLDKLPGSVKKTGVFVNETLSVVYETIRTFRLDAVQFHGDETSEYVQTFYLKNNNPHFPHVEIIKAFSIDENFEWTTLKSYAPFCNYFLFDTKTSGYGGSGRKFNWNLLEQYDNRLPFFLSGGLEPEDLKEIKNLQQLNVYAVDLNSKVEIQPGLKDVDKIKQLMQIRKELAI